MAIIETTFTVWTGAHSTLAFSLGRDLGGWASVVFTADRALGSMSKTVGPLPASIDDSDAGLVSVTLPAALTGALRPGLLWWDLTRADAGMEETLGLGRLDVRPSVRTPA